MRTLAARRALANRNGVRLCEGAPRFSCAQQRSNSVPIRRATSSKGCAQRAQRVGSVPGPNAGHRSTDPDVMSFERITVVGHVSQTTIKKSRQQVPYVRIGVAVNRGTKDNRTTVWYSVLLFGRLAENTDMLQRNYTSGRLVLVEGRPQVDMFERADGSKDIDNTIIATSLPELLDKRPEGSPQPA